MAARQRNVARDKRLVEAYKQGDLSAAEIGTEFDVTERTVYRALRRAGINPERSVRRSNVVSAESRAAAVKDYVAGTHVLVLAKRYNVSRSSILAWVRKAGYKGRTGHAAWASHPHRKGPPETQP